MDKLDAIRDRILVTQNPRVRRMKLTLVAVALLSLFFVSAIAVYAFYQAEGDVGLQAVEEAGLVTPLNLSQTIDGYTLTLTEGYADANRVAVWYRLESAEAIAPNSILLNTGLFNAADDVWFGTGAQSSSTQPSGDPRILMGMSSFDHNEPTPADGLYHLRLRVRTELVPAWTGTDTVSTEPPESLADFELDFDLPAIPSIQLEVGKEVVANDVKVTLQSLRISPSQTGLLMCFDMPSAEDWHPHLSLSIDDAVGMVTSGGTVDGKSFSLNDPQRCIDMNVAVPYDEAAQRITITVDRLQTSTPDLPEDYLLERAQERLREQGIEAELSLGDRGLTWEIIDAPDDLVEWQVGEMIWDSLREHYPGPWTFTVDLP